MDTRQLKSYGPQARREFIAAVTGRAALFGLTPKAIAPVTEQGDVAIIGGQPFPRGVAAKRVRLVERIQRDGFDQVMEAMAYTWFNRLMAIRFMELHGYLEHGYRVLSHPEGKPVPEVLEHAAEVDLPGLDRAEVLRLKLDGTRDEELYRLLLLAQCHALHQAMPFLFESLDDETELLLPDRLLHTDSPVRKLVESIDESAWESIEIVGWLYQFYISEKKDQVIGKVVKSEDIPAATQLFTPNWIVKYMVQNSLGAKWLATYPDSRLRDQMEYYIEPAEQPEEVKVQLAAITPSSLNPEELTLMDPACGSGHILVEAYELLKAIYLERGYRPRDLPKLILEKNLFGLEICPRAAQLAGFALMMKGRADDPRLLEREVKLNVMALVDSAEIDAEGLVKVLALSDCGLKRDDITGLKRLFEQATTFGSLIQVPETLAEKLPALAQLSEVSSQDLFLSDELTRLRPLVFQAALLAKQYDAVVANPPYMGSGGMNPSVKKFAKDHFPDAKSDLFACFIQRGFTLARSAGYNSMVTMESWMFLASYEKFRTEVLQQYTLRNLAHFPYDGKRPTAMGINFGVAVVSIQNTRVVRYRGHYCCSRFFELNSSGVPFEFPTVNERLKFIAADEFRRIPGSPVAYWLSDAVRRIYDRATPLGELAQARQGLATADNDRFLRHWYEPSADRIGFRVSGRDEARQSKKKWFPYNKGGAFRKWYGNQDFVINWECDGQELMAMRPKSVIRSPDKYFLESLSWSKVTSGGFSLRFFPSGFIFDVAGCSIFGDHLKVILGCMNSPIMSQAVNSISPTLNFEVGQVKDFPFISPGAHQKRLLELVEWMVATSATDWECFETSWDFKSFPLLTAAFDPTSTLESSYTAWIARNRDTIAEMKRLEEENNRLFIDAYGLQDELTPEVPIEQITLTVNPAYRYGGKLSEEEQWTRFRQDTLQELVSYAIGCVMGRYSLDAPGLIYAHSGNEGFDPSQYSNFPPDKDGIVPVTELAWFEDDAARRVEEFLSVAWDKKHLEENLAFLAANLAPKSGESSRETLRRYLATQFFKDHLQTYKNRPIYWLFSSGKQRAFQCLVYLHRYHAGTLGRMRTEYVIPLQGKMATRLQHVEGDIAKVSSTSHRKKLERERETLLKQRAELQEFDEKLRHYADLRIALDLDDGVKINYGKFGDLLAEVETVTGGSSD